MSADFTASREQFDQLLGFLNGTDAAAMAHAHLEEHLSSRGRALLNSCCRTTWTCARPASNQHQPRSPAPTR